MTTPARAMRLCDLCGGYDDFPRHVTSLPYASPDAVPSRDFLASLPEGVSPLAVAELMDATTYVRHMNCCADAGCLICAEVVAACGNAEGQALTDALTSGAADNLSNDPTTGV